MALLLAIASVLTITICPVISTANIPNIHQYPRGQRRPLLRPYPRVMAIGTRGPGVVPSPSELFGSGTGADQRAFQAEVLDESYSGPKFQSISADPQQRRRFYPVTPDDPLMFPPPSRGPAQRPPNDPLMFPPPSRGPAQPPSNDPIMFPPPSRGPAQRPPNEPLMFPPPSRGPAQRPPSSDTIEVSSSEAQMNALKEESLGVRQDILNELRSLRQLIQVQNTQGSSGKNPVKRFGDDQDVYEDDGIGISLNPDLRPKKIQVKPEKVFKNPHSSQFRDFWDYDSLPSSGGIKRDPVVLGGRN